MPVETRREDGGSFRFIYRPDLAPLRRFVPISLVGGACLVGVSAAMGILWPALVAFAGFSVAVALAIPLLIRLLPTEVALSFDGSTRRLVGPRGLDVELPADGMLVIDRYTRCTRRPRSGSTEAAGSVTVVRLGAVPGPDPRAGFEKLEASLSDRKAYYRLREPAPALPGGMTLAPSLPYGLLQTLGRTLGPGLRLSLADLTSAPPSLEDPDALAEPPVARLRRRLAFEPAALPRPPRTVHREERPHEVRLSYGINSLLLRVSFTLGACLMVAVLVVCSGGELYLGLLPVLVILLVWAGRATMRITPDDVTSQSTFFGWAWGRERVMAYDDISRVDVDQPRAGRAGLRLVVEGETRSFVAPSREAAAYLRDAILHPPERARAGAGVYR